MSETNKIIPEDQAIEAWHFLPEDRRLRYGDGRTAKAGETYSIDPPLVHCGRGLHACEKPLDALGYTPGPIISRVLVWGEIVRGDDKLCCQHRKVLWMADAASTLYRFACDVATEALDLVESKGIKIDPRSRKAIEVKLAWLRGEATDEEVAAAWDAAWDAARAAASSAAWDAARAAAWDAASAAQNRRLGDLLMNLKPAE